MEISISVNPDVPSPYHNHYRPVPTPSMGALKHLILHYVWSPIIWREGIRKSLNYLRSNYLVLDFDNGLWTLADAQAFCETQGYTCLIGTTRSHQKQKGDLPPVDRFRVVIPWDRPLTSRTAYVQNLRRISRKCPCDKQALDAARIFKPCIEIVFEQSGKPMPWAQFVEEPKPEPTVYQRAGVLPRWLQAMMEETPGEGFRNKHAFKLACKLAEHGFSEQQVVEAVCAAPINLPTKDKTDAARSGFKARRHQS